MKNNNQKQKAIITNVLLLSSGFAFVVLFVVLLINAFVPGSEDVSLLGISWGVWVAVADMIVYIITIIPIFIMIRRQNKTQPAKKRKNSGKGARTSKKGILYEAIKLEDNMIVNYFVKEIILYNDRVEIHINSPFTNGPDESQGFSFLRDIYTKLVPKAGAFGGLYIA